MKKYLLLSTSDKTDIEGIKNGLQVPDSVEIINNLVVMSPTDLPFGEYFLLLEDSMPLTLEYLLNQDGYYVSGTGSSIKELKTSVDRRKETHERFQKFSNNPKEIIFPTNLEEASQAISKIKDLGIEIKTNNLSIGNKGSLSYDEFKALLEALKYFDSREIFFDGKKL